MARGGDDLAWRRVPSMARAVGDSTRSHSAWDGSCAESDTSVRYKRRARALVAVLGSTTSHCEVKDAVRA